MCLTELEASKSNRPNPKNQDKKNIVPLALHGSLFGDSEYGQLVTLCQVETLYVKLMNLQCLSRFCCTKGVANPLVAVNCFHLLCCSAQWGDISARLGLSTQACTIHSNQLE